MSHGVEEGETCAYAIYDIKIPSWPHMKPCGKPAITYIWNRKKTKKLPRCNDHKEY